MQKMILLILIFIQTILYANYDLKKVSIQFMWHDQFQFAGFYVAKEKGYYKDLGLDVEFKKFSIDKNITDIVSRQEATFGTSSSSLLIDKSNGKDIVLLGSVFQSSPLILLGLKRDDLKKVTDIKNKKVMVTNEQQYFATLQAMLSSKNVHLNDINKIKHSFNVDDLINRNTDLMIAYTTNEPFVLKEKGYEGQIFNPKDYGFNFYEELIFTSNAFAKQNPEIVNDFYKATIKGWKYAFENIDEISKLVYEKYNPQSKSLKSLIFEANEMKKLAYTKDGEIGTITEERIRLIEHSYRLLGFLKKELNIPEFLFFLENKNKKIYLSEEEKEYLKNKSYISMCIDPNWMPFEKNENGKHIGITRDYYKILENNLGTPIKFIPTNTWSQSLKYVQEHECDILSLAMKTPMREKYLNFTKPYFITPLVVSTSIESPFIDDISQLTNKKIGITKGYALAELLKIKHPTINFIEVKDIHDGLKKVHNGELYGYIDGLTMIGYEIQNDYVGQLKISAKLDEKWELSIAVRNDVPILYSIFNKIIKTISKSEIREIENKWVSINFQNKFDYSLLYKIIAILLILIIILAIIYRQYVLKEANKELNKKITEEILKNNQQHKMLAQHTKKAAMGEMLENIAHQWRQPLSIISVAASGIKMRKEFGQLSDEELFNSVDSINKSAQFLSKTIDDFRNFYSESKHIRKFDIADALNKTLELFGMRFHQEKITIIKNINNATIESLENELIQVIINLLNNAIDALEKSEDKKIILIDTFITKDSVVIQIKDTAKGVPTELLDKIFDPYFTTKHKSQGTGIGLYMSEQIIAKHMHGTLEVKNEEFTYENQEFVGATFTITLPLEF